MPLLATTIACGVLQVLAFMGLVIHLFTDDTSPGLFIEIFSEVLLPAGFTFGFCLLWLGLVTTWTSLTLFVTLIWDILALSLMIL